MLANTARGRSLRGGSTNMSAEVTRRDFLYGAEAVALAAVLNRAYAHVAPEDLAGDEEYWKKIRAAYARDPKLINLNNGGVAPSPNSVLEAEIEAIRYSNQLPAYRMWHDLEPSIEDVRKKLAQMWNADPECIAITRNASESLQIAQFGLDLQPGDEVLTTSLHKWLSAPIGTGMLYVRKDRIEKHWALMAAPPSMDKNIRKFEEIGTHPAAMHNATLQALEFHDQIGAERKFARLRYLKNRWAERLSKVPGARVLVELEPNQSGAFGTIHFDTLEPGKLYEVLVNKYNIVVTPITGPGFNGIRVSSNVYTSPDEIDQFCAAVEAIVPRA